MRRRSHPFQKKKRTRERAQKGQVRESSRVHLGSPREVPDEFVERDVDVCAVVGAVRLHLGEEGVGLHLRQETSSLLLPAHVAPTPRASIGDEAAKPEVETQPTNH